MVVSSGGTIVMVSGWISGGMVEGKICRREDLCLMLREIEIGEGAEISAFWFRTLAG